MNKSVQLGSKQIREFEAALPECFHNTIQKTVVTMEEMKKKVKTGDVVVYNTEVIYSPVMCLLNAKQIDLKYLIKKMSCLQFHCHYLTRMLIVGLQSRRLTSKTHLRKRSHWEHL